MARRLEERLVQLAGGFDPGLARSGAAVVRLGALAREDELLELRVWTTEKSNRKQGVLASADNMRRAFEVAENMSALFTEWNGTAGRSIRVACAESMSFPRNSSVSAQIALFWGVLACAQSRLRFPLVQAGPQEIRRALGLTKGASKPEVHAQLFERYGRVKVHQALARAMAAHPGTTEKQREELSLHALDALAAVAASDGAEVVRLVRSSA